METRANYVIVGAFTILAILAGLGFFVWLAKVQINRTYTQYDILFDQVAGLAQSSPVRFNGVDVGKVLSIALDHVSDGQVRVRIEVAASTPVRVGTQATLSSQGVTGVAFVGLDGGDAGAANLSLNPLTGVAEIPFKPTVVQGLLADAPDLLHQATAVLNNFDRFTTQENADHIAKILANLDDVSGRLNTIVDDLGKTSASIAKASDNVSTFSAKLDGLATNADATLSDARSTLKDARTTLADIDAFAAKGLPQITALSGPIAKLVGDLSSLTARIGRDPARFFLGNRTPEYSR